MCRQDSVLPFPGIGDIVVSDHALERMLEREVTSDELIEALLSDRRKIKAAISLLAPEVSIRITVGKVTMIIATHPQAQFIIVTMFPRLSNREEKRRRDRAFQGGRRSRS